MNWTSLGYTIALIALIFIKISIARAVASFQFLAKYPQLPAFMIGQIKTLIQHIPEVGFGENRVERRGCCRRIMITLSPLYPPPSLLKGGALDWGVPMSHVKFKKWKCRTSLIANTSLCPLSNLRNGDVACHYRFPPSCRVAKAPCRMSNFRNGYVAMWN